MAADHYAKVVKGCLAALLVVLSVSLLMNAGHTKLHQQLISSVTNCNSVEKQTQETQNLDQRKLDLTFLGNSNVKLNSSLTASELDVKFFQYISNLHYDCEDYIRLGHSYDGGWDMCLVGPYRPTQPCLIYSFGIAWDFSFDDAASIRFGCTVRSFDPSMADTADHKRGANIWFYRTGIGGKDEKTANGWTLKTLQTLIHELNDTAKTIDYLKLDVEQAEWDSLPIIFSSGVLDNVKQIGLEIHVQYKQFYRYWTILEGLEEQGFRRWYWAMNFRGANIYTEKAGSRSYCYEMVYINTKYLKAGPR